MLHDSSNRGMSYANDALYNGFERIFGIETEYGLSVTGTQEPQDISALAMRMFEPIVRHARSTNVYLDNGSRLYLDVGSHPEYATAEARTAMDALACDLAGERIIRKLALDAQQQLPDGSIIHVFKNNADSQGHSFGCHENYLVRRFISLADITAQLLPFLITRQIFTGAGRIEGDSFTYTQRATFVDETVSSSTTRARPMVNTRDEPHANPDEFRRLHVIIGDSNRSQWATLMKLSLTHLVLCVIEDAHRRGLSSDLVHAALADPIAANLAVNEHGADACLELADGRRMSALDMQKMYRECVEIFLEQHHDIREQYSYACQEWDWVLAALEHQDVAQLATKVDWAAKRVIFDALIAKYGASIWPHIRALDLDYHDIANGTLFDALESRNAMTRLMNDDTIQESIHQAPPHTRAVLRGAFVAAAERAKVRYSCDWTEMKVIAPFHEKSVILNPFQYEPDEQYRKMLDALSKQ